MNSLTQRWRQVPRPLRTIAVAIAGALCILAGIAMLVLPGPGWATIFLGLAIWATEFKQAAHIRDALLRRFRRFIDKARVSTKR